jgi:hypothetical protein
MLFTTVQQTVQQAVQALTGRPAVSEGFTNATTNYIALLITLVLWILLVLFVAKLLWNDVLVQLVTVVKPTKNVYQMLGLMVLLQILMP